jgi:hypothetical protein
MSAETSSPDRKKFGRMKVGVGWNGNMGGAVREIDNTAVTVCRVIREAEQAHSLYCT